MLSVMFFCLQLSCTLIRSYSHVVKSHILIESNLKCFYVARTNKAYKQTMIVEFAYSTSSVTCPNIKFLLRGALAVLDFICFPEELAFKSSDFFGGQQLLTRKFA